MSCAFITSENNIVEKKIVLAEKNRVKTTISFIFNSLRELRKEKDRILLFMNISEVAFTNNQINTNVLPKIEEVQYTNLHPDYLKAELIGLSILWLIILTGGSVGFYFGDLPYVWIYYLISFVVLTVVILSYVLTIKAFRKKLYALREKDIIYKEGLFWRTQLLVPFNRIQHAEVNQGPLQRVFGLSELRIYTAGGSSSDLAISGIAHKEAQSIKYYLLHKTASDEEE